MKASDSSGFPGWNSTVLVLALSMSATVGLLVCSGGDPRHGDDRSGPRVLDSNLAQAEQVHRELAVAASRLQPPALLPLAVDAQTPSHDAPRPAEVAPTLPPVPPEQQVSLVLTSSVIGEIDPCG